MKICKGLPPNAWIISKNRFEMLQLKFSWAELLISPTVDIYIFSYSFYLYKSYAKNIYFIFFFTCNVVGWPRYFEWNKISTLLNLIQREILWWNHFIYFKYFWTIKFARYFFKHLRTKKNSFLGKLKYDFGELKL